MATPWFPAFSVAPVGGSVPYTTAMVSPGTAWLLVASGVVVAAVVVWLAQRHC